MKRIFSVILAAILLLSLCACGQKAEPAADDTPTWQEQYDLGIRYLSEGNYEEAIIAFTAAIEIDPKQADAYVSRGYAYIQSGETAENLAAALADYEQVLALNEANADSWLGLADVYIRMGDYDKALEVLREALDKTGGDQAVADKLAELESGNVNDSSGRIRRTSGYDEAGSLVWYHIYSYNQSGEKASATSYNASGVQTGQVILEYDSAGNNTVAYNYAPNDGAVGAIENRYDERGNKIEQFYYSPDGVMETRYVNEYDSNGNMIRREIYYSDEVEPSTTVLFEYNDLNQRTKLESYGVDGELDGYTIYGAYDGFGNCLEKFTYHKDGSLETREIYHYDEQGNRLGYETYDAEGNLIQSTTYE